MRQSKTRLRRQPCGLSYRTLDFFREKQHMIVPAFHSIAPSSSSSETVAKLVAESLIA